MNFPGEAKCTRTHQNFQDSFLKILQEQEKNNIKKYFVETVEGIGHFSQLRLQYNKVLQLKVRLQIWIFNC